MLPFICWYQCISYLNFTLLKKYLAHYNIVFIDNIESYIYNSYKKVKATKQYSQIS